MIDEGSIARAEDKMKKALEALKKELATIRSGRASPTILDKIMVDAYQTQMPLKQLAGISAPEARLLVIQVFDKSTVPHIEKAILKSDLGLTPNVDGTMIRLPIPQLNEERRKELVKMVKKKVEDTKVSLRNIRRDVNEELKEMEKKGSASEDEVHRAQEHVQKLTDHYGKDMDQAFVAKEKEIMEV